MKKFVSIVLVCLLVAGMLAGCGHKHNYRVAADIQGHYQYCDECGDKKKVEQHQLDEYGTCSVCYAEVVDVGDGSGCVFLYDEWGNLTEMADFDAEGNLTMSQRWVYEYKDEQMIGCKEYIDGMLVCEEKYLPKTNAEEEFDPVYCSEATYYYEDGTKEYYKYDEEGETIAYTPYDEKGEAGFTETYTYEHDADGQLTKRTVNMDGKLNRVYFYAVDEYGISYEWKVVYYDAEGNVTEQKLFDSYGNTVDENGQIVVDFPAGDDATDSDVDVPEEIS